MPAAGWTRLLFGATLLVATLLLTLPLGAPAPVPGLDPSWRLVLNTSGDAQFGRDIVFTYGPWGFLDTALITSGPAYALALLVRAGAITALWVVSVRGLTTRWPLWIAAPAVSVFVVLVASSAMSTLVVAVAAQYVLRCALTPVAPGQTRTAWAGVACIAGLAGLIIQVKFPNGAALCALAALALATNLGLGSRRSQLIGSASAAGAFVGVAGAAWLARGQSLAHVWAWVRGSVELTSGYPEAMNFEYPEPSALAYTVAVLLGVAAVAAASPLLLRRSLGRWVIALLVLAVAGGFAFKSAFTRHDDFHEGVYFVIVGALFFALVGTSRAGSWLAATGGIVATVMAVGTMAPIAGPTTAAARWRADVSVLTSPDHRDDAIVAARAAMVASHQVPDSLLRRMRDKPVSIDPYESSVAWAYQLNWRPVPIFQLYSAYTPALDRLNATTLRQAPPRQQVLRHENSFTDGRNPLWDSPLYHLALACHYRMVKAEAAWTLLAKGRWRCGQQEALGSEHVAANSRVEVPPSSGGHILLARFTPDPASLLERLGHTLVKPLTPMVAAADDIPYRLSRKTSPSGILVTFPEVENGVYAPLDVRSLAFSEPGTLEFVRVPITQ